MKILHLSDIHFGRNYTRTKITDPFEKRNEIMDGLLNCIGSIPEGQKLEHIVVTGDIAWFGKRDEYEEAKAWFLRLLKVTGLTGKDLTFCVGNHDVNWNYGKIIDTLNDKTIKEIDEAYEYKNVCDYEAPIQEYEQFCQDLGVEPYKYYVDGKVEYSYSVGYKDVLFSSKKIIRFIGFNTAMLSHECVLFDKRIRMDDTTIISETYKADVEDLRYKKETYREGDSRNVRLMADDVVHTYFILNDTKVNKQIVDSDCMTINIGHMGINNGFIYERA